MNCSETEWNLRGNGEMRLSKGGEGTSLGEFLDEGSCGYQGFYPLLTSDFLAKKSRTRALTDPGFFFFLFSYIKN